MNGAAYGKGIYLSPLAATSTGYMRMNYSNKYKVPKDTESRFLRGTDIACLALCEGNCLFRAIRLLMSDPIFIFLCR